MRPTDDELRKLLELRAKATRGERTFYQLSWDREDTDAPPYTGMDRDYISAAAKYAGAMAKELLVARATIASLRDVEKK